MTRDHANSTHIHSPSFNRGVSTSSYFRRSKELSPKKPQKSYELSTKELYGITISKKIKKPKSLSDAELLVSVEKPVLSPTYPKVKLGERDNSRTTYSRFITSLSPNIPRYFKRRSIIHDNYSIFDDNLGLNVERAPLHRYQYRSLVSYSSSLLKQRI